ncbi:phosphomethylpyrimidine kinase [Rhodococcus rhodnii LMG 5362]|uniref:Phosphomethylpyrimidine kinase n=1 Tax=Rhodococcus rhodnii LMG 5362 TaxID=1273125 RepID=R7WGZ9_9NOCA|nr:phosphomethylpyrimidine kinase [Rhodococcus rhodnii LMG 5362]
MLTVAGTDSGGGAGIAADLRALTACGVHGALAVTAVTVQNSRGVTGIHEIPHAVVTAQINAVVSDIGANVVKTGMLGSAALIEALTGTFDQLNIGSAGIPLVVDPVAASMHGSQLVDDSALTAIRSRLFPRATLITPNLDEVRLLIGHGVHSRAEQYDAAKALHDLGSRYVLVKGGHLAEDIDECVDLLYDGTDFIEYPGPRFATDNTHGSGENLGAAISAGIARGMTVPDAVAHGKRYIVEAVRHSYPLGAGHGPVSPLWAVDPWWQQ